MRCSLHFRGTYSFSRVNTWALRTKAIYFFEILQIIHPIVQHHIPQNSNPQLHLHENIKIHIVSFILGKTEKKKIYV
jgi:hypothetical protein